MTIATIDTLANLIRAADTALRKLFASTVNKLARLFARPGLSLATVTMATATAFGALVGLSPGAVFASDGTPRGPVGRLVRAVVRAAAKLIPGTDLDRAWQEARLWVDPAGRTLSSRLWRDAFLLRRRIDREVEAGLRAGLSPKELAARVEGLLTGDPGDDGRGVFRRLLHTEANRAHGLAVVERAARDGALVRWTLHTRHALGDECGRNARRDVGFGPGVYPPGRVPTHPSHPYCRCALASVAT